MKRFKANLEKTPLNLSDYYIENGIRKVYPYPFTFSAFCKERWIGKTLNELFTTEFRALSPDSIVNEFNQFKQSFNLSIIIIRIIEYRKNI